MLKVIYITGFAHNGSTLLDSLLGNHPEVLSAGEIIHFPYGLIDHVDHHCGCGQLARECPVWGDVVARWLERTGETDVDSYKRLATKFSHRRYWGQIIKWAEYHNAVFSRFARSTAKLFEVVSEISGKSIIVDSSKPAPRGLALSLIPELDVRVIHLVRDVRGAAWSFLRHKNWAGKRALWSAAFTLRVALGWHLANQAADRLCEQLGTQRSILIRYEDLISEPATTIQKIAAACALTPDGFQESLWSGPIPNMGHLMWGNNMRIEPSFNLMLDDTWRKSLSGFDQRLVMAFSGRMMRRYGYGV